MMLPRLTLLFLGAFFVASTSALDPAHAEKITVYHVNPGHFPPIPVNMDTADVLGDMFFDMRSKALSIECAQDPRSHDCTNPEVTAPDLTVNKLILEVDSRYGQYGRCNVCVNGTDGHGDNDCTDGVYVCDCSSHGPGGYEYACYHGKCYPSRHGTMNQTACESSCHGQGSAFRRDVARQSKTGAGTPERLAAPSCNGSVGRENVSSHFGTRGCSQGSPDWECWHDAVAHKTGGLWYSTTANGYCGTDPASEPANCTWRVVSMVKRISKNCSDNVIYNRVEAEDAKGAKCFDGCSGVGPTRNTSDVCWISCFYKTVLGPDSGTPGGAVTGMAISDLVDAWDAPFNSNDPSKGGCPSWSPPPPVPGAAEPEARRTTWMEVLGGSW